VIYPSRFDDARQSRSVLLSLFSFPRRVALRGPFLIFCRITKRSRWFLHFFLLGLTSPSPPFLPSTVNAPRHALSLEK